MDSSLKNGPFPTPNICKKSCRGGAGAPPSACKRKAEDCPPLMGSSPLLGWSPYVKFMVISSQENRKVAAKSPFKINRELVKILGAEPHGVTKQRSGDLMVELRSKEQERKLERVSSFLDIPVTVRPHKSLNTSRVSLSTVTSRIARRRSLWTSFLTSSPPVAFTCERETSGFLRTQSS